MKTVFVRPERCIGCRQCEIACAVEHSQSKDLAAAVTEQPPPTPRVRVEAGPAAGTAFPNRCRHCDPAPCLMVCPTGAISRDPDQGLVLVEQARCIACAMCAIVCPFAAISFHPAAVSAVDPGHAQAATKCDGCIDRVRDARVPACAEVCLVDALVYGEINDLVAEERADLTERTLAALAAAPVVPDLPETVAAWRGFGIDLKNIQRRAS